MHRGSHLEEVQENEIHLHKTISLLNYQKTSFMLVQTQHLNVSLLINQDQVDQNYLNPMHNKQMLLFVLRYRFRQLF